MTKIFRVTDDIYFSGDLEANDFLTLYENGIRVVLNLMLEVTYRAPIKNYPITLIWCPIRDGERIPHNRLRQIYAVIDEYKHKKMLIHCAAGVSRSAGIVIGQLLRENPDWYWNDAEKIVRKIKPVLPDLFIRESILAFLGRS